VPEAPQTLKNRRDFLACAKSRRWVAPGLILQGRQRREGEADTLRVGYTCSKKVGNAVARNRAKRRLRAVAAEVLPTMGRSDWDYVLIGKAGATSGRRVTDLITDLETAVTRVHAPPRPKR
jgi:ribonuclease P protein component